MYTPASSYRADRMISNRLASNLRALGKAKELIFETSAAFQEHTLHAVSLWAVPLLARRRTDHEE